jgi:hypothetical protein
VKPVQPGNDTPKALRCVKEESSGSTGTAS